MRALIGISAAAAVFAGFILLRNTIIPSGIGAIDGKLAPPPGFLNAVSSQTEVARNRVEPLRFKSNLEETKGSILQALDKVDCIELQKVEGPYIHALSKNGVFGSSTDIEFYIDENAGVVHYRSAPRLYTFSKQTCRDRYEQIVALY
ncbi:DUF1499 domain-containing protein [Desulfosediminicola ganghwensis]|uniref:DUF1499 domain-containing protein n=1 Tax=Desulfosediminicola ganghwensis TaxID=2569540 RepID=UPI0010AB539A|nr:DUF1499 domain-containing protein [Desulfosediminicola ganghwensis]